MSYKEYTVRVYKEGDREWYINGKLHREEGPAIESADGSGDWYIDGKYFTEAEFNARIKNSMEPTCENKVVEIDGIKYKLQRCD